MSAGRLGARFVIRAGRAGVLRIALGSVAIAVVTSAVLATLLVPSVLSARSDRLDARQPASADAGAEPAFSYRLVETIVGGEQIQRLYVAGAAGVTPPGATTLPERDQALVSPALHRRIATDGNVAAMFDGVDIVGEITAEALLGPDDLFAYVGIRDDGDMSEASGFGGSALFTDEISTGLVQMMLAVLIAVPAVVLLVSLLRLSAATVDRRLRSLSLLGAPDRVLFASSVGEPLASAVIGGAAGLLLGPLALRHAMTTGAFGFTAFDTDIDVDATLALVVLVLIVVLVWWLSRRSVRLVAARRGAPDTRHGPVRRRLGPVVTGTFALGLLLGTAVTCYQRGTFDRADLLFLLGTVVLLLSLPSLLGSASVASASFLAGRARTPGLRIGARRLEYEESSAMRLLVGALLLITVGVATPAFLRDATLATLGTSRFGAVDIDLVDQRQVASLLEMDAAAHLQTAIAVPAGSDLTNGYMPVVFATCEDVRNIVDVGERCVPGSITRVVDPSFGDDPPLIAVGTLVALDGTSVAFPVPSEELSIDGSVSGPLSDVILVTRRPTEQEAAGRLRLSLIVERDDLDSAVRRIAAFAPTAVVQTGIEHEKLRAYTVYRSTLDIASKVGWAMFSIGFLVILVDRLLERRANVGALLAFGVSRGLVRRSQLVQVLVPFGIATGLGVMSGTLIGNAYLAMAGLQQGWWFGDTAGTLRMLSLLGCVLTCAGSLVVAPRDLALATRTPD